MEREGEKFPSTDPKNMGLWRSFRESEAVVLFITSLWLTVCMQYFIPMLLLLPISLIPGVGAGW